MGNTAHVQVGADGPVVDDFGDAAGSAAAGFGDGADSVAGIAAAAAGSCSGSAGSYGAMCGGRVDGQATCFLHCPRQSASGCYDASRLSFAEIKELIHRPKRDKPPCSSPGAGTVEQEELRPEPSDPAAAKTLARLPPPSRPCRPRRSRTEPPSLDGRQDFIALMSEADEVAHAYPVANPRAGPRLADLPATARRPSPPPEKGDSPPSFADFAFNAQAPVERSAADQQLPATQEAARHELFQPLLALANVSREFGPIPSERAASEKPLPTAKLRSVSAPPRGGDATWDVLEERGGVVEPGLGPNRHARRGGIGAEMRRASMGMLHGLSAPKAACCLSTRLQVLPKRRESPLRSRSLDWRGDAVETCAVLTEHGEVAACVSVPFAFPALTAAEDVPELFEDSDFEGFQEMEEEAVRFHGGAVSSAEDPRHQTIRSSAGTVVGAAGAADSGTTCGMEQVVGGSTVGGAGEPVDVGTVGVAEEAAGGRNACRAEEAGRLQSFGDLASERTQSGGFKEHTL